MRLRPIIVRSRDTILDIACVLTACEFVLRAGQFAFGLILAALHLVRPFGH
jgi:hypothetical protein